MFCPVCESDEAIEVKEIHTVFYKNQSAMIDMKYTICMSCKSESTGAEQARFNANEIRAFYESVDHPNNL